MGRGESKVSDAKTVAVSMLGKSIGDNDVRITGTISNSRLARAAKEAGLGETQGTFEVLTNINGQDIRQRSIYKGIITRYGGRAYAVTGQFASKNYNESWNVTDLKTGMLVAFGESSLVRAKAAIKEADKNIRGAIAKSAEDRFKKAKKRRG